LNDEINTKKEHFKTMCFILQSDETRYGELLDDMKKGVFQEQDEYLVMVSDAYELLIQTSRQIRYTTPQINNQ